MKLCRTKAKSGFSKLRIQGPLAQTPWDTFLLALVGGGGCKRAFFLYPTQQTRHMAWRADSHPDPNPPGTKPDAIDRVAELCTETPVAAGSSAPMGGQMADASVQG